MGTHALSGETIFPSTNNVGGGKKTSEAQIAAFIAALAGGNFVVSGFTLPETSPNLNLSVAAGEAIIEGRRVYIAAATTVTCANGAENYVFLKLAYDALGNATGAVLEVNTTGSEPDHSILLGTATAAGGAVTVTEDLRTLHAAYDEDGMSLAKSLSVGGDISASGDVSAGGDGNFANVNATGEVNAATGNLTDLNVTNPISGDLAGDADTVGGQENTDFAEYVATVNAKRAGYAVYAP